MLQSSIKVGAVVAFAILTVVGPALALPPVSFYDSARLIIPIQNEENKELWRDHRPARRRQKQPSATKVRHRHRENGRKQRI